MAKKKTPRNSNKKGYKGYVISACVIILLIFAVYFVMNKAGITRNGRIAATVNGETITIDELDKKYEGLPDQYKAMITKDMLLDQIINAKLLIQEAKGRGITASDDEMNAELEKLKASYFESDGQFQEFLKENNLELKDVLSQLNEQLLINKLLEAEILSKIEVSESKIKYFYEINKELLGNVSYDEVKDQINQSILADLSDSATETYILQLRAKAQITIQGASKAKPAVNESLAAAPETKISTFKDTGDDICTEGGKPVIRFYTTSKCEPCGEVKNAFYSSLKDYADKGLIVVYHWELDTGDNLVTGKAENGLPQNELELFRKYNPKSTVPTYIFGCKYARTGNSYEDAGQEEEEFRAVVEALLQ